MLREINEKVKFTNVKDKEYLIQDKFGISLGRIYIVELNEENKYCLLRMKFYKNSDEYKLELKSSLDAIIKSLILNKRFYKLNIIVDEDVLSSPFIEMGFALEGVLWDSCIHNNTLKNEFIFGIDSDKINKSNNINILRMTGKNIELKVLTPEDADNLLEYYTRNEKYLEPYEPSRSKEFYTLEIQRKGLEESYKQYLNGSSTNFGIYKDKALIGKIQLSNIVRGVFKNAFIGYSMDEKEQNKGYMKEALNLVLDYAFNDLELHRIEASTLVDNEKSQNVLLGCGFEEIGVSKEYLFINNKWRDHKVFYRLNQ